MKKRFLATVVTFSFVVGCVYGPEHLPAFYAQRDHFQSFIDEIQGRMATDGQWWKGLSPAERERWKAYLEKACVGEKERALTAIQTLNDGIALAEAAQGTPPDSPAKPVAQAARPPE